MRYRSMALMMYLMVAVTGTGCVDYVRDTLRTKDDAQSSSGDEVAEEAEAVPAPITVTEESDRPCTPGERLSSPDRSIHPIDPSTGTFLGDDIWCTTSSEAVVECLGSTGGQDLIMLVETGPEQPVGSIPCQKDTIFMQSYEDTSRDRARTRENARFAQELQDRRDAIKRALDEREKRQSAAP